MPRCEGRATLGRSAVSFAFCNARPCTEPAERVLPALLTFHPLRRLSSRTRPHHGRDGMRDLLFPRLCSGGLQAGILHSPVIPSEAEELLSPLLVSSYPYQRESASNPPVFRTA